MTVTPYSASAVADAVAKEFKKQQSFESSDVFKLMLNGLKLRESRQWSDNEPWPACWEGVSQSAYDQFMRIMMEPPLSVDLHLNVDIEDLLADLPSVTEHTKFGIKVFIDWDAATVTFTVL